MNSLHGSWVRKYSQYVQYLVQYILHERLGMNSYEWAIVGVLDLQLYVLLIWD